MRCWNCHNAVPFDAEPCPRCGVSLAERRRNRVVLVVVLACAAVLLVLALA